ncbi:alpha/beta fold hydrolase [Acuticoccus sp. M5D2P5]|uniref:RBBP9/YdeN family alpha/beta hydrolase n=1 Tax=Acuticoccus kalidii TaxID=2910977 RepID=UPI001F34551F|nr:alpha/beta fold hydrolase [Acuticoccus kalidii]MCF3935718.1 alpha/beta fold hydrolase [Acuticoccus kalidii]
MSETPIITVPGITGSGPDHWQSLWEARDPRLSRFRPADWDTPDLGDWCAALGRAVDAAPSPPVLLAHSLGCLLILHAAARLGPVAGAVLVAMPDPDGPAFPAEAAGFRDPPAARLPFPALLVASPDDPYGPIAYPRAQAPRIGARLVEVGPSGHINAASGLGDWPEGGRLLTAFLAGLGR